LLCDTTSTYVLYALQTIDCVLQARIYLATKATPSSVKIHTRSLTTNPQLDRSPSVESILEYSQLQPYVHDVLITVRHGSTRSHFRAFLKRHKRLPTNTTLGIQGDLVIMRVASKNLQSVVNMRSSDSKLADFVVKK
jgi:hypothetical protein